MKKLLKWFQARYALWHFRQMKKEADRLHERTGKRHYVIPGREGKLIVIDTNFMNVYNKNVPKYRRISIDVLLKMAVYVTPVKR